MTLSQRILKLLGESDIPASTPQIASILATGLSCPSGRVWAKLVALERSGLVKRCGKLRVRSHDGRGGTQYTTLWGLT